MKYFVFLCIIILLSSCELKNPNEEEVPFGDLLPIDGVWAMLVVNQDGNKIETNSSFRFSRGRIITEELGNFFDRVLLNKGQVFAKSITKVEKNRYLGIFFINTSFGELCECEIEIEVKGDRLICNTDAKICDENVPYTEIIFENPKLESPDLFMMAHSETVGFSKFSISPLSEMRVKAETQKQKVAQGARVTIERSRTLRHKIYFSRTALQSSYRYYEVALNIPEVVKARAQKEILEEVQQTTGSSIQEEQTYKVRVELDGNVSEEWQLIWFDKIKTGSIEYYDENGEAEMLYFQFPISSELEVLNGK